MDFDKLLHAVEKTAAVLGATVPALPVAIEAGRAMLDLAKSLRGGLEARDQDALDSELVSLIMAMDTDVDAAVKALRGG